ncbi:MAG: hypothetical protein M1827_004379 [Pycnora praestabilis]|nr:MAG: hypothetical protein M1827_004379 [Pycnora praestabilis]
MSYGRMQIGTRSFNHNASSASEAEYDRLRGLARQEHDKRTSCFDKARQAYERGDGGAAHQLSEEGKRHGQMMDQYNKQASDYIFRENNAAGRVDGDAIDLHGQFVEEAEAILEQRIKHARSTGQTHLHVIVGKGIHSVNHVQKIKPRVEQVCQELGLQYATEENEGRLYVNLTGGPVQLPQQHGQHTGAGYQQHGQQQHSGHPGHHDQQYQQGGYQGQQQQQQQQYGGGQQQNQNNDIEQVVEKLLPKILHKISWDTQLYPYVIKNLVTCMWLKKPDEHTLPTKIALAAHFTTHPMIIKRKPVPSPADTAKTKYSALKSGTAFAPFHICGSPLSPTRLIFKNLTAEERNLCRIIPPQKAVLEQCLLEADIELGNFRAHMGKASHEPCAVCTALREHGRWPIRNRSLVYGYPDVPLPLRRWETRGRGSQDRMQAAPGATLDVVWKDGPARAVSVVNGGESPEQRTEDIWRPTGWSGTTLVSESQCLV